MVLPEILFQNAHFVILNKPAGLPVHPGPKGGPKGGPNVEDFFPQLSRRKDGPWLAHRLDTDTAGCLLIALRKTPLLAAQAEFAAGRARKTYWAIVQGTPATETGTINTPLKRITNKSGWRMVADASGQPALTDWKILGRHGDKTWLEFSPRTGRTHQIRVHAALLGCPILGDPIYGAPGPELHLLARALELDLDPPLHGQAQPPPHMRAILTACGWDEN